VRVIERNVDYIKGHFHEFFANRGSSSSGSSLFVPVISFIILFLYIINTIAWHMNETAFKERLEDQRRNPSPSEGQDSALIPDFPEEDPDPAFDKHLPWLVKILTVSPGSLLIPYNWLWTGLSVFTYYFVELYFYQVVMDIAVLFLSTTLIDPLWGRLELYRFFIVINVCVGILSTAHYILMYASKGDDATVDRSVYLYGVRIYGMTGYLAAVCVTIKQLLPDSVVFASSLGKFKNNHVPLSGLVFCWILYLFNLTSGVSVITFFYGLVIAWIYLRFIQKHPRSSSNGNISKGDLSHAFSFSTFFPNVMQPLVSLISNVIYNFAVRVKIISDYASVNSSTRVLSERLTDSFKGTTSSPSITVNYKRPQHKYHPSGDYDYLNNPPPEPTVIVGDRVTTSSTKATSRQASLIISAASSYAAKKDSPRNMSLSTDSSSQTPVASKESSSSVDLLL
jgi:hypothetical protein